MLESLAATLLNRLLGSYVENFDPEQLNVGVWSGNVKLKNLKLKRDAFDTLDLPIEVKFGMLGDLVLNVPWSSLKNKPVRISIENCYLLCIPRDWDSMDDREYAERKLNVKLRRLLEWELTTRAKQTQAKGRAQLESGSSSSSSSSALSAARGKAGGSNKANEAELKGESFMQSLVTRIIDNLQISIKNIHVRFEDTSMILSKFPSSVGMMLNELSAVSTDKDWNPSFIEITQSLTHKLLTLDSFSLYWNTDSESIVTKSLGGSLEKNILGSFEKFDPDTSQYLLKPVSGKGKLSLNKLGATQTQPQFDLQVIFDEFGLELDDAEYSDILHAVSKIGALRDNRDKPRGVKRPTVAVNENPQLWFKYVAGCVLNKVHAENEVWSWGHIKRTCDLRRKYIQLWLKKLDLPNIEDKLPSKSEEDELRELHKELSFESIILFRTLAQREFLRKKLNSKEVTPSSGTTPQTLSTSTSRESQSRLQNRQLEDSSSFSSSSAAKWFTSWFSNDTDTNKNSKDDDLVMTEEQLRELYDAIDFNEHAAISLASLELPSDQIRWKFAGSLKRGSITIKKKSASTKLASMIFSDCNLVYLSRPTSSLTTFILRNFVIEDGSPRSIFKEIISAKSPVHVDSVDDIGNDMINPLFTVAYESNPLDNSADSKLDVKLLGTTIFYHVHFLSEVFNFFTITETDQMDTIAAIISATGAAMEGWTQQTRMGIESLLDEHKTIDMNFDLQAPLLIFPLNPYSWDTPCAVIDTGHISITSDIMPRGTINELKAMSVEEYDKIDTSEINRLMFDRYRIVSQDTQILIGPNIQSSINNIKESSVDNRFMILDKMKLDITYDVSILPKAFKLPRHRIFGNLPNLSLSFNDYQYKIFWQLVDNCMLSLDDSGNDSNYVPTSMFTGIEMFAVDPQQEQKRLKDLLESYARTSEAELGQRSFEVNFSIDKVQFFVFKCTDTYSMTRDKLADIVGTDVTLKLEKTVRDMHLNLSVHSLTIDDFIVRSDNDKFKRLVSASSGGDSKKDVVELSYKRTQRIVQYEGSYIEAFDQDVDMKMAKMTLVLTPKSILTLMNYSILTFTDPTAVIPADALKHNDIDTEASPQKLLFKLNVDGLYVIFNDESQELATLNLFAFRYSQLLLPESMKLHMRFDGMELIDRMNTRFIDDEVLKKLVTMNEQELGELTYETFDPATNKNNYDSFLELTTGSMLVSYNDESVKRILNFLYKFSKMKTYFDNMRIAAINQAPSLESVNKLRMSVSIKAPIIQFPRVSQYNEDAADIIQFYLGNLFLENYFTDINSSDFKANNVKLGLRDGQISSVIILENGVSQRLFMSNQMNLSFKIIFNPFAGPEDLSCDISGRLDPLSVDVTEIQAQYLLQIIGAVQNTFSGLMSDADLGDSTNDALDSSVSIRPHPPRSTANQSSLPSKVEPDRSTLASHRNIRFKFDAPHISLELYNDTGAVTVIDNKSLTKIMLQNISAFWKSSQDGTSTGELYTTEFNVVDTRRNRDNKHTELVPGMSKEGHQLFVTGSSKPTETGMTTNISVTINEPHVILALDYLFSLKKFFDVVFVPKAAVELSSTSKSLLSSDITTGSSMNTINIGTETTQNTFHYSINVVDPAFILLAAPEELDSEAVVFRIEQLLLSAQNITSIAANNVSMFLTKMDDFEDSKVRMIDNFSSSLSIDRRDSTANSLLTQVRLSVEPLLMRISLRDIRLAMIIFNKAMTLLNLNETDKEGSTSSTKSDESSSVVSKVTEGQLNVRVPDVLEGSDSTLSASGSGSCQDISSEPAVVLRGETFEGEFGGLRLILLGDVHEMPIIDSQIASFVINGKNWSTDFDASAIVESTVNIFNYSRSSWEPLMERIPITFHLAKNLGKDVPLLFDVVFQKLAEITLSAKSIAMLSSVFSSLSGEIHLAPRGSKKPYKLVNDTGLDLNVWIKDPNDRDSKEKLTLLKSGSNIPWEFEDWESTRERLDTDNNRTSLCVSLADQKYTSIFTVNATNEGETLYVLEPPVDEVHNRMICDLRCNEENVKTITFRSTLVLENTTDVTLELKAIPNGDMDPITLRVDSMKSCCIPVEYAYSSLIFVRPIMRTDYEWSEMAISWKHLLSSSISMNSVSVNNPQLRYFLEVSSTYDRREPLARVYPRMKITISPSVIIENLLPCDIRFVTYSKKEESKASRLLHRGCKVAVHNVSLDTFLLLVVQPLLGDTQPISKPCIINTPKKSSMETESNLYLSTEDGQDLQLKLEYSYTKRSRAKVIKIYSPYIVRNATGRDLHIEGSYGNVARSKVLLDDDGKRYSLPLMFSFDDTTSSEDRARVKFRNSEWSSPLSFDAVGQSFDVTVGLIDRELECNMGVDISEGEGEFALSKIVTFSPRYMVKNDLVFPIEICEVGSISSTQIDPGKSIPLYNNRNVINKKFMIKVFAADLDWSAPFFIKDVGLTYLRLMTKRGTHMLLKLEITLRAATVFVRVRDAGNMWPYSIRNLSDVEFIFYQRDPNIVDDYYEDDLQEIEERDNIKYKTMYYKVPPKCVMPYAWDYPTARHKKLVLTARGRKRLVDLAELGSMKPMRIPARISNENVAAVDLNVVADGPIQALVISNFNPALSLYQIRDKRRRADGETSVPSSLESLPPLSGSSTSLGSTPSQTSSSGDIFERHGKTDSLIRRFNVSIEGFGISLIDKELQELAYITIRGIELCFDDTKLCHTLTWKVNWVQADNQLFDCFFPTILFPCAIPNGSNSSQNLDAHPVFVGSVSKVKGNSYGVPYFKRVTFLLQEFALQLDEDFVYAMIAFLQSSSLLWPRGKEINGGAAAAAAAARNYFNAVELPEVDEYKAQGDIYFEIFHIQPMVLHLSFVSSETIPGITTGTSDDDNDDDNNNSTPRDTLASSSFFLRALTTTVGNVNDAQIKLNSLFLDNARVSPTVLTEAIRTHYSQQFLYQVHMILGSADILGNPVGLFNTISSGFRDLFYEPYQGYLLNDKPQALGASIAKGGISFAKKTVFGLSDSVAKMTGSVAKGLSVTQDAEFQRNRMLQLRQQANSAGGKKGGGGDYNGTGGSTGVFARSAQSFASAIGSGIAGVATDPIREARKEGASGFFRGLGRGLIALPTKTAIGLLDMTSNLSQGVRDTTSRSGVGDSFDTGVPGSGGGGSGSGNGNNYVGVTRARIPRYVSHDQIIKPYDLRSAQGQYWLKSANGGLYMHDEYLAHVVLLPTKELTVIVSMQRIAEIRISSLEVMWGISYNSIQGITSEKQGIRIKLKSQSEYFIPIEDSAEKRSMFKSITVAVTEYNKYCDVVL